MSEMEMVASADSAQPQVESQDLDTQETQSQTQPVIEDPEIEFEPNFKLPKSEAAKRLKKIDELTRGSHERFQKAAEMRKTVEAVVQELIRDPANGLTRLGIDPEEFAKSYLQEKLKHYEMTPEQRRVVELEQELQKQKSEKEEYSKQQQQQVYQKKVQQFEQFFDREISQAMKTAGLPKTPGAVKRMAELLEIHLKDQIPITPNEIAEQVSGGLFSEAMEFLSSMDAETFMKRVPKEVREALRQKLLQQVQNPQISNLQQRQERSVPKDFVQKPKEYYSLAQLQRMREGREDNLRRQHQKALKGR